MSKAHLASTGQRRDVNHWIESSRVKDSIQHVSLKTGIPVFKLVESKKGRYGGTFIHPKLAVRFGIWLSDEFGYLVEEWIEEWMTTGKNPLTQAEAERLVYRDNLKSESRTRLVEQVMWHLKRSVNILIRKNEAFSLQESMMRSISLLLVRQQSPCASVCPRRWAEKSKAMS